MIDTTLISHPCLILTIKCLCKSSEFYALLHDAVIISKEIVNMLNSSLKFIWVSHENNLIHVAIY